MDSIRRMLIVGAAGNICPSLFERFEYRGMIVRHIDVLPYYDIEFPMPDTSGIFLMVDMDIENPRNDKLVLRAEVELMNTEYELVRHQDELQLFVRERNTDMHKGLIALALGSAFGGMHAMSREMLSIGALSERKADFSMPVLKERYYEPKDGKKMPTLLMKMRIPRGIHRDNHGRPQAKKLTPARASRRNGSRK